MCSDSANKRYTFVKASMFSFISQVERGEVEKNVSKTSLNFLLFFYYLLFLYYISSKSVVKNKC